MTLRIWFFGILLALVGCGQADSGIASSAPSSAVPQISVGATAPDFEMPGSDGKTHKLSQYRGEHVVLAFFPKAFTSG